MTESLHADLHGLVKEALQHAGVEVREVTDRTSLTMDLGVDSYHMVEVLRYIEEAYDLRFTLVDWVLAEQADPSAACTVGSLVAYLRQQIEPGVAPPGA
ncbi:MAG: acyl carrier protein [Candidatus Sericytochromatia bacterium]|nr:acyl carrier protein [Candidatus Sericytochromatia bacterium]